MHLVLLVQLSAKPAFEFRDDQTKKRLKCFEWSVLDIFNAKLFDALF